MGFTMAGHMVGFSPRTRGCSLAPLRTMKIQMVFPAHAGMFRAS